MKLSIIIVNYNVKHFLEQCIKSVIEACKNIEFEIFVVDNNSVDGSQEMVSTQFPEVIAINNTENKGFSTANNQAIKLAKGEYILLLNPDTVVPENCFDTVTQFMDANPKVGASGVRMVDGQGNFLPESKRGLPTPEVAFYKMVGINKLLPKSKRFGKYHLGYLPEHENNEIEILAGAFMFIRASVLDKVGLLDETFFMYGEDIDLSYRISQAGFKNYYIADTSIIHYKGESTKKLSTNYVKVFYNAMVIFANKHYSGSNKRIFTFLINSAIYARAGVTLVANFFRQYWMALVEAFLIFGSLFLLKDYWEEHIKYIKSYPKEMLTIHLPYYTLVWILSISVGGSYRQPFDFSKLIKSIVLGAALILIIYGLLPNHLHFSRGIILFGTLVVTAVLFAWRSIYHLLRFGTLDFSQGNTIKSVLIGTAEKWEKVTSLLKSYNKNYQQLGFLNDNEKSQNWLGTISQLEEVINIYGVNEVIFSSDSISTEETLELINKIGPSVNYYTIPANSDFVIGSHSKNANGLYFGEQIELNLAKREFRLQKRVFDVMISLISLVLFPLMLLVKKGRTILKNTISVLVGSKTWVGYTQSSKNLPLIKPGIFKTDYVLDEPNNLFAQKLDELYAKNYTVAKDLRALMLA